MLNVLTITGSPSRGSRASFLAKAAETSLTLAGCAVSGIDVGDMPADDLLHARTGSPAVGVLVHRIAAADAVIIATPVYKAAYTGALKMLLDVLPDAAFRGKVILPLAVGGSLLHGLAIDYALRPVVAALGASKVLDTVFATDADIVRDAEGGFGMDASVARDLANALQRLFEALHAPLPRRHPGHVPRDETSPQLAIA